MEEVVWLYFSVIAIIIAFGSIAVIVTSNKDDVNYQSVLRSLDELKAQCNYVCESGKGTNLPVDVVLPGGLVLYTNENRLCASFENNNDCRPCNCGLNLYRLDLNTTLAREALKAHTYTCRFEKEENGVSVDCQG